MSNQIIVYTCTHIILVAYLGQWQINLYTQKMSNQIIVSRQWQEFEVDESELGRVMVVVDPCRAWVDGHEDGGAGAPDGTIRS